MLVSSTTKDENRMAVGPTFVSRGMWRSSMLVIATYFFPPNPPRGVNLADTPRPPAKGAAPPLHSPALVMASPLLQSYFQSDDR